MPRPAPKAVLQVDATPHEGGYHFDGIVRDDLHEYPEAVRLQVLLSTDKSTALLMLRTMIAFLQQDWDQIVAEHLATNRDQ